MNIKRYTIHEKKNWDSFVSKAKNGHFFFYRDYMEYHKDRFQDYSLMVYDDKNRLIGIFPANVSGDEVISHEGLTFGGIVSGGDMTTSKMLQVLQCVIDYLRIKGVKQLIYKSMPVIYNTYPSDEILYALFRQRAILYRRDVSFSIYLPQRLKYQEQRRRAVCRGYRYKYNLQQSTKFDEYMQLVNTVLEKYHGTHSVHTADELRLLSNRFHNNIKLYTAELDDKIIAGTVVFQQAGVVHTQYLANSDYGRKTGALDCLLDWLITEVYKDLVWFDFGIANEQQGWYLNEGLAAQKEGFGARAVVHDFYQIKLDV